MEVSTTDTSIILSLFILIYYYDTRNIKEIIMKKDDIEDMLYSKKNMDDMADSLERYLEFVDNFCVIQDATDKEIADAKDKVKKLIKKLRKGDKSVFVKNAVSIMQDYPF